MNEMSLMSGMDVVIINVMCVMMFSEAVNDGFG